MSGQVNLDGAPLNLKSLRDRSRQDLEDLLDSISAGPKAVVLDEDLTGPVSLIIEHSALKARGVQTIYHLLPEMLDVDSSEVVYIVRPRIALMKLIAQQVTHKGTQHLRRNFTVVFVPQRSMICEKVLEEDGAYDRVRIAELCLDLIPLDTDLLSLERSSFTDCHLRSDHASLAQIARSLIKLQALAGRFGSVRGKGSLARVVVDIMTSMEQSLRTGAAAHGASAGAVVAGRAAGSLGLDQSLLLPAGASGHAESIPPRLVLIDRQVDLVTPMVTQLTYEGLIDEIFGVKHSYVDIDPEVATGGPVDPGGQRAPKIKVALNSNDALYGEVRDLNFSALRTLLRRRAEEIKEGYEERHQAQTLQQIHGFTKRLGAMEQQRKSLSTHINLAQAINQRVRSSDFMRQLECEQALIASGGEQALLGSSGASDACADFVEDLIGHGEPLPRVLRLLCLLSLISHGLKAKQLAFFRNEVLQTYGFELAFTLDRLERVGLLRKHEGRGPWPALRKGLRLVVDDADDENPEDVTFAYSGYAPLSVRIIQQACTPHWLGAQESLKSLPGPLFEHLPGAVDGAGTTRGGGGGPPARGEDQVPLTVVVFIGGCTSAEVAALRWLSTRPGATDRFIVVTTSLITGTTFVEELLDKVENGLTSHEAGGSGLSATR